jgi:hypothetical protein
VGSGWLTCPAVAGPDGTDSPRPGDAGAGADLPAGEGTCAVREELVGVLVAVAGGAPTGADCDWRCQFQMEESIPRLIAIRAVPKTRVSRTPAIAAPVTSGRFADGVFAAGGFATDCRGAPHLAQKTASLCSGVPHLGQARDAADRACSARAAVKAAPHSPQNPSPGRAAAPHRGHVDTGSVGMDSTLG